MAYDYSELMAKAGQWAEKAVATGWLTDHAAQSLRESDNRSPGSLFATPDSRPLIVAFMGGTGVGKSSLLNRLAASPVAKAGIERPTSREVTLYHYRDLAISNLPVQLPLAQIKIAQHDDAANQKIVWIDMPDFDSTEHSNKNLVLQWLPHIDVLIYVVSPERYRDEKAWRLLLAEGGKHAWLFVLNQWDRGQVEQYADFQQQLHKAGFIDPIIFTTSCTENLESDQFSALRTTLLNLADNHTVQQLEQRNQRLKIDELRTKLQHCKAVLGSVSVVKQLPEYWQQQWQQSSQMLQQGFVWPVKKLSSHYAENAANLTGLSRESFVLWDAWAQSRFADALDAFAMQADQQHVPVSPYKSGLNEWRQKAEKVLQNQTELAVRQALIKPGHAFQRGFLKFMRFLEIVLPLLALAWVSYQVFMGYYHSQMDEVPYLGVDFAVHSTLLIAITWLAPFFILRKFKPSLETSAFRGLNKGLETALATIGVEVSENIRQISQTHEALVSELDSILAACKQDVSMTQKLDADHPLNRMLIDI